MRTVMQHLVKKMFIGVSVISCLSLPLSARIVDRIMAVVNRKVITLFDVQQAEQVLREDSGIAQLTQEDVVNYLIEQELIFQAAEAEGILITEDDLQNALNGVKQQYQLQSDDALKDALAREGKTLNDFRAEIRRQLKIAKIVNQEVRAKVDVTEADIQAVYQEQITQQSQPPETRTVRQILLTVPENADAAQVEQINTQAEQLVQQLRAGADFATLAKAYSAHESAQAGGELGTFKPGELAAPFDVAFTLKSGEISDPLRSEKGFHILTAQITSAQSPASEDNLKKQIENKLLIEKTDARYQEWVETLKQQAYIEIIK